MDFGVTIEANEFDLGLFLWSLFRCRLVGECGGREFLKIGRSTCGKRDNEDLLARKTAGFLPSPIIADAEGLFAVGTVELDGHRRNSILDL
jgi:hypothetical protein